MRRAAWNADRTLSVHDDPQRAPGEGEVRVQVVNAGICGSDLHWYRGDFEPIVMRTPGHEIGGIVAAVGPGVDHVQEGDVVGVEPLLRCGQVRILRVGSLQPVSGGGRTDRHRGRRRHGAGRLRARPRRVQGSTERRR